MSRIDWRPDNHDFFAATLFGRPRTGSRAVLHHLRCRMGVADQSLSPPQNRMPIDDTRAEIRTCAARAAHRNGRAASGARPAAGSLPLVLLALMIPSPGAAAVTFPAPEATEPAADTLRLSVSEALSLLEEGSHRIAAARHRASGADAALRQARALPNPSLFAEAENLGAVEATSGVAGARGVHGTAGISLPLHVGGARARGRDVARADARLESGRLDRTRVEESVAFLRASTRLLEVEAGLDASRAELEAAEELHRTLEAGAREGRVSAGAAARARLEATRARVRVSTREADVARARAVVAASLGKGAGVRVELIPPEGCAATNGESPGSPGHVHAPNAAGPTPVRLLSDRAEQVHAREGQVRASRLPAVVPMVGWRREAGVHGLVVGVGLDLPLLDRRSAAIEEARAASRAANAELRAGELEWEGAVLAQEAAVLSLEASGAAFDDVWHESVEVTVRAAESAFREGEGTLEEVLQARRARVDALESLAAWETALREARLELAALEGRMPHEEILCTPDPREGGR